MKNVIFINGTMGVGKTTTCNHLKKILKNAVFLDGDWCWDMDPFIVTDETKQMVEDNICYLLNNFIKCSAYDNVIFCWVMHQQDIIDHILEKIDLSNCKYHFYSLICDESSLRQRLMVDIQTGKRTEDVIQRSVSRLELYENINSEKIDVSNQAADEVAAYIKRKVENL